MCSLLFQWLYCSRAGRNKNPLQISLSYWSFHNIYWKHVTWEHFVWNCHKIQIFFAYNYYYKDISHDWVMKNVLIFLCKCGRLPKSTLVYPVIITLPATGNDKSKIQDICCIVCNVCNNYCLIFGIYILNYGSFKHAGKFLIIYWVYVLFSAKTSLLYTVNLIIHTLKKLKDIWLTWQITLDFM